MSDFQAEVQVEEFYADADEQYYWYCLERETREAMDADAVAREEAVAEVDPSELPWQAGCFFSFLGDFMTLVEAMRRATTYGKWLREGKISEAENAMLMQWLKSQRAETRAAEIVADP